MEHPAETVIALGPQDAEDLLLERVSDLTQLARKDPRLLAEPVRVIVPSGSLRQHVAARLVAAGAQAGILVQTLHAFALDVLARAGESAPPGEPLVDLLAVREAREEPSLRQAFEPFDRGYRPVIGVVRDLLDAGFDPEQLEPAEEALQETRLPVADRARAYGVLRVTARVARTFREGGLGGRGELLRRATAHMREGRGLPTRQALIHGFADLTGRAADLVEAIGQHLPTTVYLDHPRDPEDAGREDAGVRYAARFRDRMASHGALVPSTSAPRFSERAFFRAPGAEAEVREVARRLRTELDAGTPPERLAIVARDLSGYRSAIRVQLRRLGIPFSGDRARAPWDGPARRILALLELFEQKDTTPADRWLDACARLKQETDEGKRFRRPDQELRLALRVAGAGRVGEVADLEAATLLEHDRLALPVRGGVSNVAPEDASSTRFAGFTAPRFKLPGDRLRAAITAAGAVRRRLERWKPRAPLAWHLVEFERLRQRELGWQASDPAEKRLAGMLEALAQGLGDQVVGADELAGLLRKTLLPGVAPPLGGEGGGVQVLEAMEARARTFTHLFLVGLNQDLFPRSPVEDPLLPDSARGTLSTLWPEIPIKQRARDEDRYLFAQLVSAAPRVTLSWQITGDDGKPKVISPLVERLTLGAEVDTAPPLLPQDPAQAPHDDLRPAYEHAILAGLHGGRKEVEPRLERALAEVDLPRPGAAAAARWQVLDAIESGPFEPRRMAPWLGFLGEQSEAGVRPDPLDEALFITRFEGLARCTWKAMLEKLLRIEPSPDPLDSLPKVEKFLVGNLVHGVLQRVVDQALGDDRELKLEEVLEREPVPVEWPAPEVVDAWLEEEARNQIATSQPATPGIVRTACELARPHLDRARDFLVTEARQFGGGLLGAEVLGRASVSLADGSKLPVLFRADRVERRGETLVLSDYKTGRAKDPAGLFANGIARGLDLQPIAYAVAAEEAGAQARGRYLYLAAEETAGISVELSDASEYEAALGKTLGTLVDAWRAGVFAPRVEDVSGKPNDSCKWCEVSSACVLQDSGARRALRSWIAGSVGEPQLEEPLRAVWTLGEDER